MKLEMIEIGLLERINLEMSRKDEIEMIKNNKFGNEWK
jgi:hypothetical protein